MAAKPAWIAGWTGAHVRHAGGMFRQGRNPAARVYESIGADCFLAVAPGWLNLGLSRSSSRRRGCQPGGPHPPGSVPPLACCSGR